MSDEYGTCTRCGRWVLGYKTTGGFLAWQHVCPTTSGGSMKRYTVLQTMTSAGDAYHRMEPDDDGAWVQYADAVYWRGQCEMLEAENARLRDDVRDLHDTADRLAEALAKDDEDIDELREENDHLTRYRRDQFAAAALTGLLSNPGIVDNCNAEAWIAEHVWKQVDAMLKEDTHETH